MIHPLQIDKIIQTIFHIEITIHRLWIYSFSPEMVGNIIY